MAEVEEWTRFVTRVLAPNPGPMTLEGTNTLVIRAAGNEAAVVVDPGPDDEHIGTLLGFGPIELILLTHHHSDHTESATRLSAVTGAPVRAVDPALCIGALPLEDGELIVAGGTRIEVVATPGHTADSVSFFLPDDVVTGATRAGAMITGDTILGRGTAIIARPDGSLADYLRSLDHLAAFGPVGVLPAHGRMLSELDAISRRYAVHRRDRLASVRAVLSDLGREPSTDPETVAVVVDTVYADVASELRFAAEASTFAQLEYLADHTGG